MMGATRGQSTLEYILVVSAILAAVFVAARTFGTAVNQNVMNAAQTSIADAAGRLPGAGGAVH